MSSLTMECTTPRGTPATEGAAEKNDAVPREGLSLDDSTVEEVMFTFIDKDDKKYLVPRKAVISSNLLCNMLEDDKTCEDAKFDKCMPITVQRTAEYMTYHLKTQPKDIEKPLRSHNLAELVDEWDFKMLESMGDGPGVGEGQDQMFDMMLFANYLGLDSLLMLACAKCASLLKGRTPAEIRKKFNIRDDFSPEEEEAVRKEHADLLNDPNHVPAESNKKARIEEVKKDT